MLFGRGHRTKEETLFYTPTRCILSTGRIDCVATCLRNPECSLITLQQKKRIHNKKQFDCCLHSEVMDGDATFDNRSVDIFEITRKIKGQI